MIISNRAIVKIRILLFILLNAYFGSAQKTLTYSDAEQELQKNNLLLLAEQFNISAAQAAVIQARIWEQPYFVADFNVVNPQDKKVLDVGRNGQKGLSIEQLIYLGGKKKNEIAFSQSNVAIAELQFEQLLRNLKYQLAQTFYSVYFDQQKIVVIEAQVNKLDTLLLNYEIQANKGNIPLKEVVRLQSLVLNLKNEKNTLLSDVIEAQQTLSLLTGVQGQIIPVANDLALIEKFQTTLISKDSVLTLAMRNNLDYLTVQRISESQELLLKWQKSLAIPDLTAGLSYDQRGGAFNNQVNMTLGIPLPFWNKNKGAIRVAEAQIKQTNLNRDYKKLELQTKVETLWALWLQQQNQLNTINKLAAQNLENVYQGMVLNFQKRNISMLEFTDFMESYNQTSIQLNEIKKAWILASISLNYITNTEIF